uniref:Uncharacterized protein n=1 Tax=Amphimedon queenslandica TaxID=400682 RepID=A0A1X7SEX8_AMPQE
MFLLLRLAASTMSLLVLALILLCAFMGSFSSERFSRFASGKYSGSAWGIISQAWPDPCENGGSGTSCIPDLFSTTMASGGAAAALAAYVIIMNN